MLSVWPAEQLGKAQTSLRQARGTGGSTDQVLCNSGVRLTRFLYPGNDGLGNRDCGRLDPDWNPITRECDRPGERVGDFACWNKPWIGADQEKVWRVSDGYLEGRLGTGEEV